MKTSAAEKHLTLQEFADRMNVPIRTVYNWRALHKGPAAMKVGKHVRYRLADVEAWEQKLLDQDAA